MSENDLSDQAGRGPDGFASGAQWIRADFHLHTWADKEFRYEGEETQYVARYVEALQAAGIRLGVITNHNKFQFDEFKALRKKARKHGIGLLPGVELSVGDGSQGIHTLIVFSDAWIDGHDYINAFLSSTFRGKAPAEYENENGRTSTSLLETLSHLEETGRDYFLVFAHVEDTSGLWHELNGGRIRELGQDERFRRRTLGFQKVRTHDAPRGVACRVKVKEWLGGGYPAEVEGSDPKGIAEIGKGEHRCFLKLSELSFAAAQFALRDAEARVAKAPQVHRASHVLRLEVEGGVLDGKTLHFSPELNTLIGIRGSGKSSILEILRYALDLPRGDKAQDVTYKDALIRHTLGSGGKVTVHACDSNGQEFTVSRIFGELPNVYLQGVLQPGVSIRETVLRRPIYFGQKDLSSTGDGFETDLVEKMVAEKLRTLREEIAVQRQRVREAVERWQRVSTHGDRRAEYERERSDAEFRLRTYEALGVAEKLKRRNGFQQDADALRRLRERAGDFVSDLTGLIAKHEDELRNARGYVSIENPAFFVDYFAEFGSLCTTVEQLKAMELGARGVLERLAEKALAFERTRTNLQEEFAATERELAAELRKAGKTEIQLDDFPRQQQRKSRAELMLATLDREASQMTALHDALEREIEKLNALWLREFKAIQEELDRVNRSGTPLSIEAEFKGDREAAIGFMQQMVRGSGIRETTLRGAMEGVSDFGVLLRSMVRDGEAAGGHSALFKETFLKNLEDFVTWQVPNRFVIRFQGKELQQHSLGQRASALLLFVLSQEQNDVVIIDQPEDDLDNQTIYSDVIKMVRELKPRVQFIFATHNANFPVLGDAEQVVACRYEDDAVHLETGSIDALQVQNHIIRIMEGGREAFDRRKEVYRLWKSRS